MQKRKNAKPIKSTKKTYMWMVPSTSTVYMLNGLKIKPKADPKFFLVERLNTDSRWHNNSKNACVNIDIRQNGMLRLKKSFWSWNNNYKWI